MPRKPGTTCGRDGCVGILHAHTTDITSEPRPSTALRCDTCHEVLVIVDEPGRPIVEAWLMDMGLDEPWPDFVARTRRGGRGPLGGPNVG